MTTPDWRTSTLGAQKRVALWLHSEVGLNGTFTKQQLRDAFPKVEQIDRRMRDLRPEGWVIATYREDRSLSVDELRLVEEGGSVWRKGYRSRQPASVSDKQRQATFAADSYMCRFCGISAGERYPDDNLRTATLTLSRDPAGLVTCCDRCRAGQPTVESADTLLADIAGLAEDARSRLIDWVHADARTFDIEVELWSRYRRLPQEQRDVVLSALRANESTA